MSTQVQTLKLLAALNEIIPTYVSAADHNNEAGYTTGVKTCVNQLREREK